MTVKAWLAVALYVLFLLLLCEGITQANGDLVYEQTQEKFDLASFKGVADFIGDG